MAKADLILELDPGAKAPGKTLLQESYFALSFRAGYQLLIILWL